MSRIAHITADIAAKGCDIIALQRSHVHVEDGGAEGKVGTTHTHGLFHAKDLGTVSVSLSQMGRKRKHLLVQGGLVEVLQRLSNEEEGQKEHVDAATNALVLLFSLSISPSSLMTDLIA